MAGERDDFGGGKGSIKLVFIRLLPLKKKKERRKKGRWREGRRKERKKERKKGKEEQTTVIKREKARLSAQPDQSNSRVPAGRHNAFPSSQRELPTYKGGGGGRGNI
jgi:hypothetical protein